MPNGNLLMRMKTPHRGGRNDVSRKFAEVPDSYSRRGGCVGRLIRERFVLVPAPQIAMPSGSIERWQPGSRSPFRLHEAKTASMELDTGWKNTTCFKAAHGVRSDHLAIERLPTGSQVNRTDSVDRGPPVLFSPAVLTQKAFPIGRAAPLGVGPLRCQSQLNRSLSRRQVRYASELFYGCAVGDLLVVSEREVWRSRVDGTEKLQLTRAPGSGTTFLVGQ